MTIAKHINNSEYINTMERRMIRKQELKEDKEKGKQIRKKKRNRWKNWNSEFSYKTEYISAFWFFYYVSLIIDTILRNEPYNPHQEENLVPDIFHKQVYYINPLLMGRHIPRFNLRFMTRKDVFCILLSTIVFPLFFLIKFDI